MELETGSVIAVTKRVSRWQCPSGILNVYVMLLVNWLIGLFFSFTL